MEKEAQYIRLLESMEELHNTIRRAVRASIRDQAEHMAEVAYSGHGDVSYGIDVKSEEIINRWFTLHPPEGGAVVLCEGLGKGVYPAGLDEEGARWRILMDPLDGTRHIMYDNRSCWILTGIAPNLGKNTRLSDIGAAIQTEVPATMQDKGITLKAIRHSMLQTSLYDLRSDSITEQVMELRPSMASTLENGFAVFSNFFPGTKEAICSVEESVLQRLYGEPRENGALIFSEQYISNAGQLYMAASGKYRMIADIRAELSDFQRKRGRKLPLCTHPYDLSASLIMEEAGCILVNKAGLPLDFPMDLETNCAWYCYANRALFEKIHPIVTEELDRLLQG